MPGSTRLPPSTSTAWAPGRERPSSSPSTSDQARSFGAATRVGSTRGEPALLTSRGTLTSTGSPGRSLTKVFEKAAAVRSTPAGLRFNAGRLMPRLSALQNRQQALRELSDADAVGKIHARNPAIDLARLLAEERRHGQHGAELAGGADEEEWKFVHGENHCTGSFGRGCKKAFGAKHLLPLGRELAHR